MFDLLKIEIKTNARMSREIREKERHYLNNGRSLLGIFKKKHKLDEKYPEKSEKTLKAEKLKNANELALEAYDKFWGLHRFRTNVLRRESRDALLAYGFLKGMPYLSIENNSKFKPDLENVERIVTSYTKEDIRDVMQRFEEWKQEVIKYFG